MEHNPTRKESSYKFTSNDAIFPFFARYTMPTSRIKPNVWHMTPTKQVKNIFLKLLQTKKLKQIIDSENESGSDDGLLHFLNILMKNQ